MSAPVVFWTAFNSYRSEKWLRNLPAGSVHPVATAAWTDRRVDLWKKFTLPSILAQTMADWRYVILLDPELRSLTEPRLPKIEDPRVIYCYDDQIVLEQLRVHPEIILALIDGDDMYSRRAGEVMAACPAPWMYFKFGYALDTVSRTVWQYDTIGTGPFFACRMDPRTLLVFDRDKRHPNHKAVMALNPQQLPAGHFCVVLHGANTSSRPDMRYVLREKPVNPRIIRREFGGQA